MYRRYIDILSIHGSVLSPEASSTPHHRRAIQQVDDEPNLLVLQTSVFFAKTLYD